jgi:hypothetical protein
MSFQRIAIYFEQHTMFFVVSGFCFSEERRNLQFELFEAEANGRMETVKEQFRSVKEKDSIFYGGNMASNKDFQRITSPNSIYIL